MTAAYLSINRWQITVQLSILNFNISAFILSRQDYCNALLYLLDILHQVQNAAARLTVKASKSDHITPILHSLHWLPVAARIQYKVSSLCYIYSSLSDSGPENMSKVLWIYMPSRQLHNSHNAQWRAYSVRLFDPEMGSSLDPEFKSLLADTNSVPPLI